MHGRCLIHKKNEITDKMGQILTITEDGDRLILEGVFLRPIKIKNYLFTAASLQRGSWSDPLEIYSEEDGGKLLGAGELKYKDNTLWFEIGLLDEKIISDLKVTVNTFGLYAYEKFYPIVPVFEIKENDILCTICDEPIGKCKHEVEKDYLRRRCAAKVISFKVKRLAWSGIRD